MLARTIIWHAGRRALFHLHRRAYASSTLTPKQTKIVQSTIPALEKHGVEITTLFYRQLLDKHPELRNMFNTAHQDTGEQPATLAHAVWAYAVNIENPDAMKTAISRIGHKHASLGVTADQYPIVGQGLLSAIKQVLGDGVNSQYFITFEEGLYHEAMASPGGWKGCRKFLISDKVQESKEIISFHLTPADKGALPSYKPGQFVSIRCFVPELGTYQPRQYSLSDVPNGKFFQISVKREFASDRKPAGRVSNVLHESLPEGSEMDISMPFGDFILDVNATTPVVLISGGVGLTPMMAMLKKITEEGKSRTVVFIHAARNSRVHAMKNTLIDIARDNPEVTRLVYYEQVEEGDILGLDYDHEGRVNLAEVKDKVVLPGADYYICGLPPFMNTQSKALRDLGVGEKRIRMEVFGSPSS
ncbi:bacterial hemoglobin [Fusarium redolens]|uniref:nitric oxide dioxygenase n=1 Tax=Fusarium redolens TaxID=48865 RepID=A0A9P9GZL9_FUSRE|nr:bacterial hemoglobin [Fusarium redolens]KAH7247610.1 bacterial hemoglobin [Fusarium redolens]